jgi:hypothetical protein
MRTFAGMPLAARAEEGVEAADRQQARRAAAQTAPRTALVQGRRKREQRPATHAASKPLFRGAHGHVQHRGGRLRWHGQGGRRGGGLARRKREVRDERWRRPTLEHPYQHLSGGPHFFALLAGVVHHARLVYVAVQTPLRGFSGTPRWLHGTVRESSAIVRGSCTTFDLSTKPAYDLRE